MPHDSLRSYLFTFDINQFDPDDAARELDRVPEIVNWTQMFPGTMALISALPPRELGAKLKQALPGQRFLLVPVEKGQRSGWLPKSIWEFMNAPAMVA